jgi:7-cyano-7-deazaguanine synthase in queuosine biosynthesis
MCFQYGHRAHWELEESAALEEYWDIQHNLVVNLSTDRE